MSAGDPLVGRTLGAFRIEAKIGSGATGVVYRALHDPSGRPAALKVLHDNLGSIGGLERRFSREARVLAKLSHPSIVEILAFGVEDGHTFIAMELLEGETLEEQLGRGAIDPKLALGYYDPILDALAAAHEAEVVHRDLKPANVFLTKSGGVKVLDFGLAKMLSVEETSQEGTLTRKGRIVGTPAYMAPEQITGVFIDVRADVYALGVMLYELLADRRPFLYERRRDLLRAHLLEPVPPLSKVRPALEVDPALETLLAKALAKDPADRFANARAMLEALRALPPEPVRLVAGQRRTARTRTGPSSAVISDGERKEVTESAGLSASGGATLVHPPVEFGSERDRPTEVPARPGGVSTPGLFVIAAVLFGAAAALWMAFMLHR
ncbi:MAG TPA: serine/threonine-protein kinase [Sandaracinaceae bacterium]